MLKEKRKHLKTSGWPGVFLFLFSVLCAGKIQAQTYVYPSPSDDRPVSAPAQLQGQSFQTDLFTGTASTSIPIVVPPGTGGMHPSLALTYNSGSRVETFLAVGWDLSGLGYIERSTRFGVPTYTSADTYVLAMNGMNDLVFVAADGFYHTKQETFLRIQFISASNYWVVTDKKGAQYRFGYNADSKSEAIGRNATRRWLLDEVTDTRGNRMSVTYNNDSANGMIYPTTITYTQGNGLTNFRTVEFNYETRPDVWTSYRYGAPMTITNRLAYIDVKMNGAMVRRYELIYSNSVNSNNSLLTQVREYGSDATSTRGTGTFPPPMTVQYSSSANNFNATGSGNWMTQTTSWTMFADFTGDGRTDIGYCVDNQWYMAVSTGTSFSRSSITWGGPGCGVYSSQSPPSYGDFPVSFGDSNGDGKADLVVKTSAGLAVYLSTGSSFNFGWNWSIPSVTGYNPALPIQLMLADFDSDGKVDLGYPLQYGAGSPKCNNFNISGSCYGFWVQLSTGTGFGSAVQWIAYPLSSDNYAPLSTHALDLNGDGKSDLLLNWQNHGGLQVMLSTGINFNNAGTWLNPAPTDGVGFWRFGDFNGDGLLDFADLTNIQTRVQAFVYLNTGTGFVSSGVPWIDISGNTWFNVYPADFNGDGKTDLVGQEQTAPAPYYWGVHLSTGAGFGATGSGNWASVTGITPQFYDFNGDGKTDLVDYGSYSASANVQLSGNAINLATTIKNSFGGSVSSNYVASSNYSNTYLPFVQQTVSSVTTDDGMGHSFTTNYSYQGGKYDIPSREFRGFSLVTATDPTGAYTKTGFLQTDQLKGKPSSVETYDVTNTLYAKAVNTWSYTTPFTGAVFPFLSQEDLYSYDGGAAAKQARTKYVYDSYGNVKEIDRLGDVGITTDDRYDYMEFAYNPSTYIVSLPSRVYTNNSAGIKVSETWNYYDGATNYTTAPTKGDLTQVCRWLAGGTNPCATFGYDVYGNRTSATDANGNTSSIVYDATYQTFPVTETNALNQSVTKTYWGVNTALTPIAGTYAVPGMAATVTDPNMVRIDSYWDALGRPSATVIPPNIAAAPTTKSVYYNYQSATSPAGTLVQKRINVGQGTIDAYTFVDGLGRTIQTKTPAPDGTNQMVTDTTYNSRGLAETVSIPYLKPITSTYVAPNTAVKKTTTLYDPLQRVSRVTGTDETYSTASYDRWTATSIDPNGRKKVKTYDAFGRLTQVDEYTGADGRNPAIPATTFTLYATTTYAYDLFDAAGNNIQTIVDTLGNKTTTTHDTLGRKIAMHDPDMGDWSYTYDPTGNLKTQTDAKGQVVTFVYDPLNRIKTKTVSDTSPPSAPAALIATAAGTAQVNLIWTASTDNVGVDHYEVERRSNAATYTLVASPPTGSYTDAVSPATAYLYRVRAVDAAGNASGYSNIDLATTVLFTDNPLVVGTTPVNAQHFTELRQAVNAVRLTAGLAASVWTDPILAGLFIQKIHIEELRSNLTPALTALGFTAPIYTDPTLTAGSTLIKKVHIEDLRQAVK